MAEAAEEVDPAASTLAGIEARKSGATRSFRSTRQIDPTRNRRGARAGPTAILLFPMPPMLIRAPGLWRIPDPLSAFGLVLGRGEGSEDGEHRIEVGQARTEAIDEIAEGEVAFQQVVMVVFHVVGQVAHQGGMHLL